MPVIIGRVGHGADLVVGHAQLAVHIFDDDRSAGRVAHDVMKGQGRAELLFDLGVAHHPDLRHRLAHFIHGLEVAQDVIDEIDIADRRRQFVVFQLLVFGEAWKEERADGQARLRSCRRSHKRGRPR